MKKIIKKIKYLCDNLGDYWFNMKPNYLKIYSWDLFHVDDDIFWELETIIGEKTIVLYNERDK